MIIIVIQNMEFFYDMSDESHAPFPISPSFQLVLPPHLRADADPMALQQQRAPAGFNKCLSSTGAWAVLASLMKK